MRHIRTTIPIVGLIILIPIAQIVLFGSDPPPVNTELLVREPTPTTSIIVDDVETFDPPPLPEPTPSPTTIEWVFDFSTPEVLGEQVDRELVWTEVPGERQREVIARTP